MTATSSHWPGIIHQPQPCQKCGRLGVVSMYAEGGGMAVVHGMYELWCERCVLEKQIDHAEERAASLPELRARLAALSDTTPEADRPEATDSVV